MESQVHFTESGANLNYAVTFVEEKASLTRRDAMAFPGHRDSA